MITLKRRLSVRKIVTLTALAAIILFVARCICIYIINSNLVKELAENDKYYQTIEEALEKSIAIYKNANKINVASIESSGSETQKMDGFSRYSNTMREFMSIRSKGLEIRLLESTQMLDDIRIKRKNNRALLQEAAIKARRPYMSRF